MPLLLGEKRRIFILVICIIETLTMSGILYGWNGLVETWTKMGVYGCPDNSSASTSEYMVEDETPVIAIPKSSCDKDHQAMMLRIAFIATSGIQFVFTLPCGMFFDRFGLRVSKLTNAGLFLLSCIVMAFVSASTPYLLFPGGILLSLAAPFILLCNFQIAGLFPNHGSSVVATISGSFDSSSVMFQLMSFGYDGGISLTASFIILGVCGAVTMCFIAIFLFHGKTITESPESKAMDVPLEETPEAAKMVPEENHNQVQNEEEASASAPSLCDILRSRHYILQMVWFSCNLLRFQFFLTAMTQHVKYRYPTGGPEVPRIFLALSLFLFGGIIFAPIAGLTVDFLKKRLKPDGQEITQESALRAIGIAQAICSISSIILTVLIYVPGEAVFYILFFFEAFMRAFLFSLNGAFAVDYYPGKLFGILFGIMFLIGGLFSAIQFALEQFSFIWANAIVLVVCIISLVQPANLIIGSKGCCK